MILEAEFFRNGEYLKYAKEYWRGHHTEQDPADFIFSRYGIAINHAGKPVVLLHMYFAVQAPIVMFGFTVSDPKASKATVGKALRLAHEHAEKAAREENYRLIFTNYDHPALHKLMQSMDYKKGSETVEYWKELK